MKRSRWSAFATILVASVSRFLTTSATRGAAGDEDPMLENSVKYAGADKPDGFRVLRVGQDLERLFPAAVGTFDCEEERGAREARRVLIQPAWGGPAPWSAWWRRPLPP